MDYVKCDIGYDEAYPVWYAFSRGEGDRSARASDKAVPKAVFERWQHIEALYDDAQREMEAYNKGKAP